MEVITNEYYIIYYIILGSTSGLSFQYLGKFVFEFDRSSNINNPIIVGTISLSITSNNNNNNKDSSSNNFDLGVFLYDDGDSNSGEKDSWNAIYVDNKMTCSDRLMLAKSVTVRNQSLETPYSLRFNNNDNNLTATITIDITESVRPRYWYVVLAHKNNCNLP